METPKTIFTNQPKLSEDKADEKFNERRLALLPIIEKYISGYEHFAGEKVKVTFAETGVSSLVSIIETEKEKFVLKMPLSKSYSLGEAQFLKVWEQAGVKVPHIFDEGVIDGESYVLMEYIDAPMIRGAYTDEEMIEKGVYTEMGNILRLMHEPRGEGYGNVIDGKGEYETFAEWLNGADMQKRMAYVQENKVLPDILELLPKIFEILKDHAEKENKSSFCHDDFAGNIFATDPLTVFDPNPRFNNRYVDVGRTMMNFLARNLYPKQILESYFANETCDEKVLQASIFLGIFMKLTYAHKKGNLERIQNWQNYINQNKHLL